MTQALYYYACKANLPRVFAMADPSLPDDCTAAQDDLLTRRMLWEREHPDIQLVRRHTICGLDHRVETPDSSNVRNVSFWGATKTLVVEFEGGSIYQYFDVEPAVFHAIITAESVGRVFNDLVKRAKTPFEKVA